MARESHDARVNPVATTEQPTVYVQPRESLTEDQQWYWDVTVRSRPAEYFREADIPVLTQYVRHKAQADILAAYITAAGALPYDELDVSRYQKLLKMQAEETAKIMACARSMRITHQAVYDAKTANTAAGATGGGGESSSRPWEA